MEVKPGFWNPERGSLSPEQMCPFNRSNRYKDYVKGFPGPDFVSREWRCPLRRGVPKKRFHCMRKGYHL